VCIYTEKYFLKEPKDYHYLNQSDVYTLPNVDEKLDWERMRVRCDRQPLCT
jgi:myosin heavy subunit